MKTKNLVLEGRKVQETFQKSLNISESRVPSRSNPAEYHQHKIAVDTLKNPSKSLLGGPSVKEAEEILRKKFKYTDAEIKRLKTTNESLDESGVQTSNDFEAKIEHELDTIRRTVGLILSKSGSVVSDKHKLRHLESDVKRRFTDVEKLLDAHRDQVMELFRDALRAIDA